MSNCENFQKTAHSLLTRPRNRVLTYKPWWLKVWQCLFPATHPCLRSQQQTWKCQTWSNFSTWPVKWSHWNPELIYFNLLDCKLEQWRRCCTCSSAPRVHVGIFALCEWEEPEFAHCPVLTQLGWSLGVSRAGQGTLLTPSPTSLGRGESVLFQCW